MIVRVELNSDCGAAEIKEAWAGENPIELCV
jgi:hypothetical protein